jgi:hypothetical protein
MMPRTPKTILSIPLILTAVSTVIAVSTNFSRGLIQSSCAPWDGPAIAITLAAETQCDRTPTGPYLSMGVWRGLPLHDGQVVKFDSRSNDGYGSRCSKENDCQRAESGTIEFEKYNEGSGARGRYELHFKSGETLTGTFEVQWCKTRTICG